MATRLLFYIILLFSIFYFLNSNLIVSAASVNISADVQGFCGNGVVNSGEECDGSNLNGKSCSTQGFSGGTLSCNANCTFNTSACTSSGGGGGGGGGGGSGFFS